MKWKIISWVCFVVGVALIVVPIDSMREQIGRYPLDVGQAELAAKFYVRGFWDKTVWAMVSVGFFSLSMLLRSMAERQKNKSANQAAQDTARKLADPGR